MAIWRDLMLEKKEEEEKNNNYKRTERRELAGYLYDFGNWTRMRKAGKKEKEREKKL